IGTMNALAGLAAQLDLSSGFEGNLRIVTGQRDDMTILLLGLPVKSLTQFFKNVLDAAAAEVGNRFGRSPVNADLFVLGSDAPTVARLSGAVEKGFQLFCFFNDDRHGCGYVAGKAGG